MSFRSLAALAAVTLSLAVVPARAEVHVRLEALMREDAELVALAADLAATLSSTLDALPPTHKETLTFEHRRWLDGLGEECIFAIEGDPPWRRNTEVQCLRNRLTKRIGQLRAEPARQAIALPQSGPDADICRMTMAEENFTWTGRSGSSRGIFADQFTYALPGGVKEAKWEPVGRGYSTSVDSIRADADGDGRPELIFRVTSQRVIKAAWYVVATSHEEGALKDLFLAALAATPDKEQPALAAIQDRLGGGREPVYLASVLTDAMWNGWWIYTLSSQRPADLGSELVSIPFVPETQASERPFVKSTILVQGGRAYVLGDSGTGVVALFRPHAGEPMELVCRHVATSSTVVARANTMTDRYPCPPTAGMALADITWDHYEPYPARTMLDLPDWGGRRPLVRVQSKHGYIFPHVFVGSPGAAQVEAPAKREDRPDDHWQPLFDAVAHDELDIRRSPDGGVYLVGRDYPQPRDRSQEPPTTYYRIAGNGLFPVCRVEDQTIPPAGYKVAR